MNKKFIIIILLICGCFYRNLKINSNSQEFTFKVVSYNAIPSDSLESNIFIKIPLTPLVFRKTEGNFESNLEISIKIKDSISESQISRFSWQEKIIEEYQKKFYGEKLNIKNAIALVKDRETARRDHYRKIKEPIREKGSQEILDVVDSFQSEAEISTEIPKLQ